MTTLFNINQEKTRSFPITAIMSPGNPVFDSSTDTQLQMRQDDVGSEILSILPSRGNLRGRGCLHLGLMQHHIIIVVVITCDYGARDHIAVFHLTGSIDYVAPSSEIPYWCDSLRVLVSGDDTEKRSDIEYFCLKSHFFFQP